MTVNSIAKNQLNDSFIKLSTMKRINSAADDASGLAISEKMESLIRGFDKGIDNTLDMQNLVKTAEGGLAGIDDSLQRIRELGVQASNGIYTDSDRALIQTEVSQLIEGINQMAKNTEFNAQKLLDGSFTNKNTASYPDGTGSTVSIPDMSALAIGIQNFDVTKMVYDPDDEVMKPGFYLNDIDNAMASVNAARSYLGAMSNKFDYTVSSNSITMLNQAAAKSRIADLDVAKGSTDYNKARIINEAQIFMQKNKQENEGNKISLLK